MPNNRCLIGRLIKNTVTGNDSGSAHTGANSQGEIPGCYYRCHAFGLIKVFVHLTWRTAHTSRPGKANHLTGVVLQKVNCFGHIVVGLVPLLARFEDLPGGQFVNSASGDFCRLDEISGAFARGGITPALEGILCGADGILYFLCAGLAHTTNNLVWLGRIYRIQQGLGGHFFAADEKRVGFSQFFSNLSDSCGKGVSNLQE